MKASLDTNVIIHLYKANLQEVMFQRFDEGIYIYQQIRAVELENHGRDILPLVDRDIEARRIWVYTDAELKEKGVLSIFQNHVYENEMLYSPQDRGEVYAISLAQTLGAYSLVTDDIKQGGPYMSLLQFEDNAILPLTYADVLFLNYLSGLINEREVIEYFERISTASFLDWSLRSHLARFIRRFWAEPYQEHEKLWMAEWCREQGVNAKEKLKALRALITNE